MNRIDEFDVVIRKRGGKVTAGIPQLALYARADDVQTALSALEQKKLAFFRDLEEAGELTDIEVRPYTAARVKPRRESGIGQFALKAAIVIGLIAGAVVVPTALLLPKIERVVGDAQARMERVVGDAQARMEQLTKVGGPQFWTKVERELERNAEPSRDLDEAQRKKILSQLHVIVQRWRPFVAEIAPLFWEFQRPTPSPAPQDGR